MASRTDYNDAMEVMNRYLYEPESDYQEELGKYRDMEDDLADLFYRVRTDIEMTEGWMVVRDEGGSE